MPCRLYRARVGELADLDIGAAVAQLSMPSGPALGWPEQSSTRSAPKQTADMSRTFLILRSGVLTLQYLQWLPAAELARQL